MKYGSSDLPFNPDRASSNLCHLEPAVETSVSAFRELLIQHLPLEGIRSLGIVVADKTRLCEYPTYLPVLTSYLMESGISPSSITFYIAYGTHAPQSRKESREAYGESFDKFRFTHHNSRENAGFIHLGTSARGSSVNINKEVLQHDRIITFGAILHHYFAGYGGGRKLLFPGLAAYDSIMENHRIFLDFEQMGIRGGCQSGELEQNPLAQDLEEIHRMLPPHLEIHAILNSHKTVCELYAGVSYEVFRKVCKRYDSFFRRKGGPQFDLVVASAGGFPKDINFIQAHKSIHNAA
jgi:nickel-dependent lactate racemase